MDKTILGMITVLLIVLVAYGLILLWYIWPVLREAEATNKRLTRLENMQIDKTTTPTFGSPIKAENEKDFNSSFGFWG